MVAKEVAEAMHCFDTIEFLDDHSSLAVGCLADMEKLAYDAIFVAMGDPALRRQYYKKAKKAATLVHPLAMVSPSAQVGEGSIVESGAAVCANATVGRGCIVMSNAVVGHDAKVGDFCQLKYNCVVEERVALPAEKKVECGQIVTK